MDLRQFEVELRNAIAPLPYVTSVNIKQRTDISLQGIIGLKKSYKLTVFFNEMYYVIAFSLVYRKKRIWAIDRDNRIGWHTHPTNNPDAHEPINEITINQIINEFDAIYQKFSE